MSSGRPICIDGMSIWADNVRNYDGIQSLEQLLKGVMHTRIPSEAEL